VTNIFHHGQKTFVNEYFENLMEEELKKKTAEVPFGFFCGLHRLLKKWITPLCYL
jgi:hypothetical protein